LIRAVGIARTADAAGQVRWRAGLQSNHPDYSRKINRTSDAASRRLAVAIENADVERVRAQAATLLLLNEVSREMTRSDVEDCGRAAEQVKRVIDYQI